MTTDPDAPNLDQIVEAAWSSENMDAVVDMLLRSPARIPEVWRPLADHDGGRVFRLASAMSARLPNPREQMQLWILVALELDSPDVARPFLTEALVRAERLLNSADPDAGSALLQVVTMLARAESATGDLESARQRLVALRRLFRSRGWYEFEPYVLCEQVEVALVEDEWELAGRLAQDLIATGHRDQEDPLAKRTANVLTKAAYAAYYTVGNLELAVELATAALERVKDDQLSLLVLGSALTRLGRNSEALHAWARLEALAAGQPGASFNRALVLEELGQTDDAIEVLKAVIAAHPHYARARLVRGRILRHAGLVDRAAEDIIAGLSAGLIGDADVELLSQLGLELIAAREAAGKLPEALDELAELTKAPIDRVRHLGYRLRAKVSSQLGATANAVLDLTHALDFDLRDDQGRPMRDDYARLDRVDALLADDRLNEAFQDLEILVEPFGEPEAAIERLNDVLAESPDCPTALLLRGKARNSLLILEDAEADFTAALEHQPGLAEAHLWRGTTRLSTAARLDQDSWNETASRERWFAGLRDIGVAAALGHGDSRETYRWAVDRACGDSFLKTRLLLEASKPAGMHTLLPGAAAANRLEMEGHVSAHARDWASATAAYSSARNAFRDAHLPLEALRVGLSLADIALRLGRPQDALDHLETFAGFTAVLGVPLESWTREEAADLVRTRAARGADALSLQLEFLHFLTATMQEQHLREAHLRAQALAYLGDTHNAARALGDLDDLKRASRDPSFRYINRAELLHSAGLILRDAGRLDDALVLETEAAGLAKEDDNPHLQAAAELGRCGIHLDSGNLPEAEASLRRATDAAGDIAGEIQLALQHYRARVERSAGRLENSLRLLQLPTSGVTPRQRFAYVLLMAQVLRELGRMPEADSAAQEAERLADEARTVVRDPVLRAYSQGHWETARRIRIEVARAATDSERVLRLVMGLKARVLAEQLDPSLVGSDSRLHDDLEIERAIVVERDLLVEVLESRDRGEPAHVDWEVMARLGESAESLVDETGCGARVAVDRVITALEDAERRLARVRDRIAASAGHPPAGSAPPSLADLWSLLRT